jgi:hypothetical protein
MIFEAALKSAKDPGVTRMYRRKKALAMTIFFPNLQHPAVIKSNVHPRIF